jgi:hypothetical protein
VGNTWFTSTPTGAIVGGSVIIANGVAPALSAIDLATGTRIWSWQTLAAGLCAPAVMGDGTIAGLCTSTGMVAAVARNGSQTGSGTLMSTALGTTSAYNARLGHVYVAGAGFVIAFDRLLRTTVWSASLSSSYSASSVHIALSPGGERLYVSTGSAIVALRSTNGQQEWRVSGPGLWPTVGADDTVYVGGQQAIDGPTAIVKWERWALNVPSNEFMGATPAALSADGQTLYLAYRTRVVTNNWPYTTTETAFITARRTSDGAVVWNTPVLWQAVASWSVPALGPDGSVYVCFNMPVVGVTLVSVQGSTGWVQWSYNWNITTPSAEVTLMFADDGTLVVRIPGSGGSRGATVDAIYAFPPTPVTPSLPPSMTASPSWSSTPSVSSTSYIWNRPPTSPGLPPLSGIGATILGLSLWSVGISTLAVTMLHCRRAHRMRPLTPNGAAAVVAAESREHEVLCFVLCLLAGVVGLAFAVAYMLAYHNGCCRKPHASALAGSDASAAEAQGVMLTTMPAPLTAMPRPIMAPHAPLTSAGGVLMEFTVTQPATVTVGSTWLLSPPPPPPPAAHVMHLPPPPPPPPPPPAHGPSGPPDWGKGTGAAVAAGAAPTVAVMPGATAGAGGIAPPGLYPPVPAPAHFGSSV